VIKLTGNLHCEPITIVDYQELQEEGDRNLIRPPTKGSYISMAQSTVFFAIAQEVGTPLLFSDGNVLLGLNYLRSVENIG
jgi:hypothetical protein